MLLKLIHFCMRKSEKILTIQYMFLSKAGYNMLENHLAKSLWSRRYERYFQRPKFARVPPTVMLLLMYRILYIASNVLTQVTGSVSWITTFTACGGPREQNSPFELTANVVGFSALILSREQI